jgi:hypothetical protein
VAFHKDNNNSPMLKDVSEAKANAQKGGKYSLLHSIAIVLPNKALYETCIQLYNLRFNFFAVPF